MINDDTRNKMKLLAYYLPQFHPIPENDLWWGKGFTEWTNVTKAKPLFKGHYQPILPADLGFYDLRVPEVQRQQAELAKKYGIDGFIYYQYWFGDGKMLLEKPAEAMLKDKNVDLPFCFCWANETWKGIWHGLDNPEVLIEQVYNGIEEYKKYFNYLLPFFNDERYIKIDDKPMFHVYKLDTIPDLEIFIDVFNKLAIENGYKGIYLVATGNQHSEKIVKHPEVNGVVGLEVFNEMRYSQKTYFDRKTILGRIENRLYYEIGYTDHIGKRLKPLILDYAKGVKKFHINFPHEKHISCVFPNWDNSARSGKKSLIFKNATPKAWGIHLSKAVEALKINPNNPPYIVIKSWNEWAEGNYLEPDLKFGHQWLEVIKKVKEKISK